VQLSAAVQHLASLTTSRVCTAGNEAGNGRNFHAAFREVKRLDASRPVQYERALKDPMAVRFDRHHWGHVDFNTELLVPMYPYPSELEEYATQNGSMPLVMCEVCAPSAHARLRASG
jgi:beta-galactosidase